MNNQTKENLLYNLNERAKELACIYRIDAALKNFDTDLSEVFLNVLKAIPPGWQYPDICSAKLSYHGQVFKLENYIETPVSQKADILIEGDNAGKIFVYYTGPVTEDEIPDFLPEEQKLLNTISARLANYLFNRKLKESVGEWTNVKNVIDSIEKKEGKLFKILSKYNIEEIVNYFESPSKDVNSPEELEVILDNRSGKHWKWRLEMAEKIAENIDATRFGVKAVYLTGSVKNAISGPGSDIDLTVHFSGNESQLKVLNAWLEGWSLCLSEMNFQKTGVKTDYMLDVHIITDDDIANKTSYAVQIDTVTDKAKLLKSFN
ncbi:MAG: nucleotidyltransferase domain-containing protein [FCB group bacterium]|jgi:predicted nucleotidyltransferase